MTKFEWRMKEGKQPLLFNSPFGIRISEFRLADIGPQGASVLPRLGRMPAGGRMVQRLPSTPAKSLCRLCEEAE